MAKDSSEKSSCYLGIKTLQIWAVCTEFFLFPIGHLKQLSFLSFPTKFASVISLPHRCQSFH